MIKHTFARLAWVTVAFVILAQIVQVPGIETGLKALEGNPYGRALIIAVLCTWAATAIGLWLTSIVYAHQRAKRTDARYYPVAVLIVTNFIGALVYYFAFARRHPESELQTRLPPR